MRKRFLSLNLALLMLFTMLPLGAVPASAADGDNGYAVYYKNDGTDESVSDTIGVFLTSSAALKLYEAMPAFVAEDKAVTSYNSAADGGGTSYALSSTLLESYTTDSGAPGTLYAQWEDAPGNHILYISTDGLSAGGKDYVLDSSLSGTVTLRGEDTFSPTEGGKVIGWTTTPRYYGADDVYTINSDVEILGDLTLYSISGVNYITFHYNEYDYTSIQGTPVETTRFYQQNDNLINSYNIERSIYVDNGIFVGWNEREDGTGSWYNSNDEAVAAPNDLYAQYEIYPSEGEYCVLTTSNHPFASGQQSMILPLADGKATLPQTLADGKIAAYYWSWGTGSEKIYYPSSKEVEIEHRANLTAVTVNPSSYYGIIDGDGGQTSSGSKYSATSCFVTSAGNLNIYSFNDMATFTKDGQAVSGYKGEKTGAVYGVDDDIWAAMGTEAEANQIANFTAQYQTVTGGYIQYFGNGAQTSDGASYTIQDGLYFAALGGATFTANPFVAPAGQSFIGWNTQADGSGDWYDAGSVITLDENTVLYAQWGDSRLTYHFYDSWGDSTVTKIDEETISPSKSYKSHAFNGMIVKTANQYQLLQHASFDRLGDYVTRLDAIKLIVALGEMRVDTSNSVTLPFDDCDDLTDLEKAIVQAVLDAGIELGSGSNQLDPDSPFTRAQMATLIWRTIGEPSASVTKTYSDVEDSQWFYESVTTLLNLGILSSEADSFSANSVVTWRDALRWIVTAYEWKQDGAVKSSGLLEDNYDLLLFEGWNTSPDGNGTWYCTGSDVPAGSVLHLYESWILPPSTGYYYVLLAPKLDNGRMVKVVIMSAETESVTMPNSGQLGWASGTVQEAGFLDDESSIHLPGTTVEVTSGTQYRSLRPYTYAEFHENCNGHQEQRVYYNLVSNGRLSLYGPSDIFSDLPSDVTFKQWNTAADGSGTAYAVGQNISDGSYMLYAQWNSDSGGETGGGTPTPSLRPTNLTLTADRTILTGGGTVVLNARGLQIDDFVTLDCDKTVSITKESDISWSVTLPNATAMYTFTANFAGNNTYSPATATCTVSVIHQGDGGGSDGGAGGSSYTDSFHTPSTPPAGSVTVPISGDDGSINVGASVKGDTATINKVDLRKLATVIGDDVQTGSVTIDFSGLNSSKPITTVEIPSDVVKEIAAAVSDPNNDAHSFAVILSDGTSIEFDAVALGEKAAQADGLDITISIEQHEDANLTNAQKATVGDRPAFDINVTSGGEHISDMGGKITVHAPYELKAGEKARGIVVWYVDDLGNREQCETSYDSVKKRVNWKTNHLSLYMIDYDETLAVNPFSDVSEDSYYSNAVLWALDEGITSGTSATTFSPDAPCTRAQMATFLWRAAGSPGPEGAAHPFIDVPIDAYYAKAVQWAYEQGISGGTSATTYGPDEACTRGQMATFLWRNAGSKVPVNNANQFTDIRADKYYAVAVQWAYEQKITSGTSATIFSPDDPCTRAQMVTFLYRNFVK